MKVSSTPSKLGSVAAEGLDKTSGKKTDGVSTKKDLNSAKAADVNQTEKVNLSQKVYDMKKVKEMATPNDSIDEAKVARLQALIDAGEYKVDADAIADRLVDEHLNMPS